QNNDLLVKSSRFKIEGNGKADIESGNVEYRFLTKLVKTPATEVAPEKFHSTPIVVNMTGTFEEPVYQLDMSALMTEKNKAKIEKLIDKNKDKIDKLKHKLDKKFGPGVSDLLKKLF
ncbi:MAG TPA: AsmA family protein, partial [Methylomicrobium sp.]|nr:AsmA family protein [Methylomicrobium sp.]